MPLPVAVRIQLGGKDICHPFESADRRKRPGALTVSRDIDVAASIHCDIHAIVFKPSSSPEKRIPHERARAGVQLGGKGIGQSTLVTSDRRTPRRGAATCNVHVCVPSRRDANAAVEIVVLIARRRAEEGVPLQRATTVQLGDKGILVSTQGSD